MYIWIDIPTLKVLSKGGGSLERRCVLSSVIRREERRSCLQKEGNIIYDQSILQRCILLVWRWRFSILMDGVLNGSIWQRIFVFSSLLITLYVKIKKIFHFSSVDSMFNIFEIKFILMHYLLTNEDDEQILSEIKNNPLTCFVVFFNPKT